MMGKLWNWTKGKRTIIIALVFFTLGMLAYYKVIPDPKSLGLVLANANGLAIGFRLAFGDFTRNLLNQPNEVGDDSAMSDVAAIERTDTIRQ
jgi:hypothetical protein